MKTSTIIRFVSAALLATLACVGLVLDIRGLAFLWSVTWLLVIGREELTKPIPHKEFRLTFLMISGLLVVLLTLPFLHLPHLPEPRGTIREIFAVVMWVLWIWAIYYRWRQEKRKVNA